MVPTFSVVYFTGGTLPTKKKWSKWAPIAGGRRPPNGRSSRHLRGTAPSAGGTGRSSPRASSTTSRNSTRPGPPNRRKSRLMAVGQKSGNPKMGCSGKWKHGLKPAVLWWFNFDPYPYEDLYGAL